MKAAAVTWVIRKIGTEIEFLDHLTELVELAASRGAELIVLPENIVLELLHILPELPEYKIPYELSKFDEQIEDRLYQLADSTRAVIVGGTHFTKESDGYKNISLVAYPPTQEFLIADNELVAGHFQRKVKMTGWERDEWLVTPGDGLQKLHDSRIGVTICYDSEFPEASRALCEVGMLVQCVPSYTETLRGFHRVRWSCHARAIENQIYVAHASLGGSLGRQPVPATFGTSAIICPSVEPFPESCVLAETTEGEEGVAVADLDFATLLAARETGDVRNWNDRSAECWTILDH